jgi:hypothetical protein
VSNWFIKFNLSQLPVPNRSNKSQEGNFFFLQVSACNSVIIQYCSPFGYGPVTSSKLVTMVQPREKLSAQVLARVSDSFNMSQSRSVSKVSKFLILSQVMTQSVELSNSSNVSRSHVSAELNETIQYCWGAGLLSKAGSER